MELPNINLFKKVSKTVQKKKEIKSTSARKLTTKIHIDKKRYQKYLNGQTPFVFFYKEKISKIKNKNKTFTHKEITDSLKEASKIWKNMISSDKKKYIEKAFQYKISNLSSKELIEDNNYMIKKEEKNKEKEKKRELKLLQRKRKLEEKLNKNKNYQKLELRRLIQYLKANRSKQSSVLLTPKTSTSSEKESLNYYNVSENKTHFINLNPKKNKRSNTKKGQKPEINIFSFFSVIILVHVFFAFLYFFPLF